MRQLATIADRPGSSSLTSFIALDQSSGDVTGAGLPMVGTTHIDGLESA
jgi:hypothetical protein